MLDHSQTDVTGQSYIDAFDELRSVVERLPVPPNFETKQIKAARFG
jgi:hypothetical protein